MNKENMEKNNVLKLVVNDFISVNHYLAYRAIVKNGKPMAMSYKTQDAKKFQKEFTEYVKEQAKIQNWITDPNPMQHYYVDAVFYFPRIDMDTNNYWKVAFDAITDSGVVWVDDNMACERVQRVLYDSENPRIEYTIYKTDFCGVFDKFSVLSCTNICSFSLKASQIEIFVSSVTGPPVSTSICLNLIPLGIRNGFGDNSSFI